MPNQGSEVEEQLLSVWEGVRPREASGLKFIVMDEDGNFAGQFTCDEDEHGDRYFVVQQAPRTKKWSFASNLVRNLSAEEAELPKTALKGRQVYTEIVEKAVYRVDLSQRAENYASDYSAERWLEKQQVKKWYEDRIEGLPGDEYIQRCMRIVDWWIKTTSNREKVATMFNTFTRDFPTDSEGYDCNQKAELDIQALQTYLQIDHNKSQGDEGWLDLTQAVAECAVGCLIEINEDIAENVDSEELKEHFLNVREFWDDFYTSAFSAQTSGIDHKQGDEIRQECREESNNNSFTSSEATDGGTEEDRLFNQCCQDALNAIIDGLKDPSHVLNSVGGFSKIPDDFRFLAVLQVGIEDGHLTKEGILLYACLKAYCVSLLRRFFIIERNERLESKSVEPTEKIQRLIEEKSEQLRLDLEVEVSKMICSCYVALRDFRSTRPAAFRISFEHQLSDAIDMALAGLRDAAQRSIELQSSSDIEVDESIAALMHAYAPINFSDFTDRVSKSPWAFYELQPLCEEVLDDLVEDPRVLLSRIFHQWLELESQEPEGTTDQLMNEASSEITESVIAKASEDYLQAAFADFSSFIFNELKTNPQLQDEFRNKEIIEIVKLAKCRGYLQMLATPEDLIKFILNYDIDRLLWESNAHGQVPRNEDAHALDLPKTGESIDKRITPIKGVDLIAKDKALGDAIPEVKARASGYLTPSGEGDTEAYYAALYEAHRSKRA